MNWSALYFSLTCPVVFEFIFVFAFKVVKTLVGGDMVGPPGPNIWIDLLLVFFTRMNSRICIWIYICICLQSCENSCGWEDGGWPPPPGPNGHQTITASPELSAKEVPYSFLVHFWLVKNQIPHNTNKERKYKRKGRSRFHNWAQWIRKYFPTRTSTLHWRDFPFLPSLPNICLWKVKFGMCHCTGFQDVNICWFFSFHF